MGRTACSTPSSPSWSTAVPASKRGKTGGLVGPLVDFALSDDEALIQKTVRELARGPIAERAARLDRDSEFPAESMRDLAALGMLGATIPEKFGGSPVTKVAFNLMLEELAWACASTSVTAAVHMSVAASPIVEFGLDEHHAHLHGPQDEWLRTRSEPAHARESSPWG